MTIDEVLKKLKTGCRWYPLIKMSIFPAIFFVVIHCKKIAMFRSIASDAYQIESSLSEHVSGGFLEDNSQVF
jgi:hypothetical protein